jgi:hypothetical protein
MATRISHLRRCVGQQTEATARARGRHLTWCRLAHHSRMGEPGSASPLLTDLGALLDHVGERGVPLTDTGRLRMADVRAINDRFVAPAELTERFAEHIHRARREDEVWRVHFVRLVAQAAGVLDARVGRIRRTTRARLFVRLAPDEASAGFSSHGGGRARGISSRSRVPST